MSHLLSDREPLWQFAVRFFPHVQSMQAMQGDAGARQYYRLATGQAAPASAILVDSRADKAGCARFLRLSALLKEAALPVPEIYAVNAEGDCLLIEDLGDTCLDTALAADAETAMPPLLDLLGKWQRHTSALQGQIPAYSADILREELSRFEIWFLPHFVGVPTSAAASKAFEQEAQSLIRMILAQQRAAVHRDFHCRNLMRSPDGRLVLIDYQDALWGAASYDAVSLTRDCYVAYSHAQRLAWEEDFRRHYLPHIDSGDWQIHCHAQSLQRHLKILGLFVRLAMQEGKSRYLANLPQVWADSLWESRALAEQLPYIASLCADIHERVQVQFAQRGLR